MLIRKILLVTIIAAFAVGVSASDDPGITGYDPAGQTSPAVDNPASTVAPEPAPPAAVPRIDSKQDRNVDDWELIESEEVFFQIPEADYFGISFDPLTETLTFIDHSEEPTQAQQDAIDRAPAWLRQDLYNSFRRFEYPTIADLVAYQILSAPDPYVDEVCFQAAHIAPGLLGGVMYLELLLENAQWIYAIDSLLNYVQIVDYGTSADDDYYTTAVYRMVDESGSIVEVEIDKEQYYWFVVHPKLSDEVPTYINPDNGNAAAPPLGVFWRPWFWTYVDTGYPLFGDLWADCDYLWDRTGASTDAIDVVNGWISDVMNWNVGSERPIQPVRIYKLHQGYCGEHQDMRNAAARTALIPSASASNLCEDHVWNEFWDGTEWIHWDGGDINNPLLYENGWGKTLSAVFNWRGDGYVWTVSERYSADVCTLNVTIYDSLGKPADGERIKIYSDGWYGGTYYATWGITNSHGEVSFLLGDDQNYYLRVDGPLGAYPTNTSLTVTAITGSVAGQSYYWEHTMDLYTPDLAIDPAEDPPNPDDQYRMEIDYEVLHESVFGNYFTYNSVIPIQFNEAMTTGYTDFFIVDETNKTAYEALEPAEGFEIAQNTVTGLVDFVLPTDDPWYAIFSSRELSINRPYLRAVVNVYRTATGVSEPVLGDIPTQFSLSSPYPNPFNREAVVHFALPKQSDVHLVAYDLLGREVAKLAQGQYSAGNHELTWQVDAGIASGIYIIKLETTDFQSSRKICYLR